MFSKHGEVEIFFYCGKLLFVKKDLGCTKVQQLDASGNSHVSACIFPNTVDAFLQDRKSLPWHMNAGLHSIIFDESLQNSFIS